MGKAMSLKSYDGVMSNVITAVELKQVSVFYCGKCGSAAFTLFELPGQDHMHLQCRGCGMEYCQAKGIEAFLRSEQILGFNEQEVNDGAN